MTSQSGGSPPGPSRWQDVAGPDAGAGYAARFAALAADGADVHGEARLCASLVPAGSRVLDAGCGTGRVAARLAELGYACVGVDADPSMLAQAQALSSQVRWVLADLAGLVDTADLTAASPATSSSIISPTTADAAGSSCDQATPEVPAATLARPSPPFDIVVLAGNVVPLLADGTHERVLRLLARALRLGGLVVAGFGLDPAHLPLDFAPVDLDSYDRWCELAGLELRYRFGTWDGDPYDGGGYAVSVHRRVVRGPGSRRGQGRP